MVVTNKQTVSLAVLVLLALTLIYLSSRSPEAERNPLPATGKEVEAMLARPAAPPDSGGLFKPGDYFIEYRLQRDKVRSQEIKMLENIVNNPNSTAEARQEAQRRLLDITTEMEQELELEAVLEAKGYPETVVFIRSEEVTVVVNTPELSPEEATRIADVVSRSTGKKLEDIVIIPKGKSGNAGLQ